MAGRLEGKRALITGGASGLGAAMAKLFAAEGARVALSDLNLAGAQAMAEAINAEYQGAACAFEHDVADEQSWKDVVAAADAALVGFNVLVNNAGIGSLGSVEEESFENWKRVMAVDADSVFLGCKTALKVMKDHAPGSIINISSIAGLYAAGNMSAYNAAKAAVWLLSKSVALHCATKGYEIRSNSIHPVFIKTPILDGFAQVVGVEDNEQMYGLLARGVPMGRIGEPEDVAYAALYLASDESKFVTGIELKIDGGMSAQ